MSGDVHVRFRESPGVRFPRATHLVVHCATKRQAEYVNNAIGRRLRECQLEMHPEKTRIVYCKDGHRRGTHDHIRFVFLSYEFRARQARGKDGKLFDGFNPAISPDEAQRIRSEIRSWRLGRWTGKTLPELAAWMNPRVQGWINYYGHFYRSEMLSLLRNINEHLARWARRKYRRLHASPTQAFHYLARIARQKPGLFVHWRVGVLP